MSSRIPAGRRGGRVRIGWRAATAGLAGVALGSAAGLPMMSLDPGPAIVLLLALAGLYAIVRVSVPRKAVPTVMSVVVIAFALRAASAVLLYTFSSIAGRGGFVTGDDAGYAAVAWGFAQYLRGAPEPPFAPPGWGGAAYLFGPFTYLEAAVFFLFGPRPLLVELLNAAIASAAIVPLYRISRSTLGKPAALLTSGTVAVYPSLVLWSALNLRESLAFLVAAATIWAILEARRTGAVRSILAAAAWSLAAQSIRGFAFVGLVAAALSAGLLASNVRIREPRRVIAAIGATAVLVLALAAIWPGGPPAQALRRLETYREGMANEARTAFYRPPPTVGSEGETFVVIMRPSAGSLFVPFGQAAELPTYLRGRIEREGAPATVSLTPTVIWVRPPVQLALARPGDPARDGDVILVTPGDLVIVGEPSQGPAPPGAPRPLALNDLRGERPAARLEPASYRPEQEVALRTLLHIPLGLAYALGSPFPFDQRRAVDVLTVPEMLAWYGAIAAAAWTLVTRRERLGRSLPVLAYVVTVFVIFVAAEGNTGILFRHRAMVIPYMLMFAAPGVLELARRVRSGRRTEHRA